MRIRYLVALYFLAWCWLLCGCSALRRDASSITTAGGVTVGSRGPVETPAKVDTAAQVLTLPLPAGSTVTAQDVTTPGPVTPGLSQSPRDAAAPASGRAVTVTLSAPSELRVETRSETVTAPTNHAPPAPPSPSDLADGRAVWVYRLALLVGLAAAAFGLVRGWDFVMYGGAAVAVAAAVALFVQSHPVLVAVIGAGVALAGAGVFVWHFRLKERQTPARPLTVRSN